MNSVLVAMFDTEIDAIAARSKLTAAGFAADALQMIGGQASAATTRSSTTTAPSTTAPAMAAHSENAITRFFENLFGSDDDDDADFGRHRTAYAEAVERGSYGLAVRTASPAEMDDATEILNAAGAIDIDERSEAWRKDRSTADAGQDVRAGTVAAGATQKLQEVKEEINVGKRVVDRGGVRVFTRVTETPVAESVTLREEHAAIKRTAVDRVATPADLAAFKEGSIEVRETAEEAVVSKTARVIGEVEVGKTTTEREETIRDTVRQTKVEVEEFATDRDGTVRRTA